VADALALEFDPAVRDTAREAPTPEPSVVPVPAFADQRPVAQCVVVGYQTDGTNVTGLILARADGDRLKFAGVVQEGISPALRKELLGRLSRLVREESLIPGLKIKGALWVKPGVFCDVTHGGVDKQGQLDQPALKELKD